MNGFWLMVVVVVGGLCLYTGEWVGVVLAVAIAIVGTQLEKGMRK